MNQIRWAISCGYWLVSVLAKEIACPLLGVSSGAAGSLRGGVVTSGSAISSLCSGRPIGIWDSCSHADSPVLGEVLDRIFNGSASSWVYGAVVLVLVGGNGGDVELLGGGGAWFFGHRRPKVAEGTVGGEASLNFSSCFHGFSPLVYLGFIGVSVVDTRHSCRRVALIGDDHKRVQKVFFEFFAFVDSCVRDLQCAMSGGRKVSVAIFLS